MPQTIVTLALSGLNIILQYKFQNADYHTFNRTKFLRGSSKEIHQVPIGIILRRGHWLFFFENALTEKPLFNTRLANWGGGVAT
jgi:hypothetical protein